MEKVREHGTITVRVIRKLEKAASEPDIEFIKDDYPDGYFEIFGAIRDSSFTNPEDLSFAADEKRVSI
ncbi:MAG: hypothetical protein WA705_25890 [Candidatus Ozemobacteraceae bacterium]